MARGMRLVALCLALLAAITRPSAAEEGGAVHVLTSDTFDSAVSAGTWLVKFYAPWCGHCKHLAPIFEAAADRVKGQVNFAKVDATVHSDLKERFEVTGYPTLKVLRDGEVSDFKGRRTEDGFALFAARMSGPAVHKLSSMKAYRELTSDEANSVSFILFRAPDGVGSADVDDAAAHAAFKAVARSMQATHVFGSTRLKELVNKYAVEAPAKGKGKGNGKGKTTEGDEEEGARHTLPFVARVEKGEAPVYLDLPVNDDGEAELSEETLRAFVVKNQFPLLCTDEHFHELTKSGKLVATAIVNPDAGRATRTFKNGIKALARPTSPLPPAVRERYHFMWIDGVRWSEFVAQFNVSPEQLPRLVVLDRENSVFYEDPEVDEVDEVETFLVDVVEGRVPVQREGFWGYPARGMRFMSAWSPYSWIGAAAVLGMVVWACCFAPDDDEGADMVHKHAE